MNLTDEIHLVIKAERDRQRAEGYTDGADDRLPLPAWVALLTRHAGLAVDDGGAVPLDRFRRQMVRTAAIAVAALESLDRQHRTPKGGGD